MATIPQARTALDNLEALRRRLIEATESSLCDAGNVKDGLFYRVADARRAIVKFERSVRVERALQRLRGRIDGTVLGNAGTKQDSNKE